MRRQVIEEILVSQQDSFITLVGAVAWSPYIGWEPGSVFCKESGPMHMGRWLTRCAQFATRLKLFRAILRGPTVWFREGVQSMHLYLSSRCGRIERWQSCLRRLSLRVSYLCSGLCRSCLTYSSPRPREPPTTRATFSGWLLDKAVHAIPLTCVQESQRGRVDWNLQILPNPWLNLSSIVPQG